MRRPTLALGRRAPHANAAPYRPYRPRHELPSLRQEVADGDPVCDRAGSRKTVQRGIHLQELRDDARSRARIAVKRPTPMPDLKLKLEQLFADAADCEMVGRLAADADKRTQYRQRADELRAVAERVRAQLSQRPRSDAD